MRLCGTTQVLNISENRYLEQKKLKKTLFSLKLDEMIVYHRLPTTILSSKMQNLAMSKILKKNYICVHSMCFFWGKKNNQENTSISPKLTEWIEWIELSFND